MDMSNVQINTLHETDPESLEKATREIVQDVLAGREERFEELFNLYHNRVYALAWSMTQNYDDAMDIVQECFLRSFRALNSWKGRAKFTTWLHRITVNAAIDYIRREVRHRNRRLEALGDPDRDDEVLRLAEGVNRKTPLTELQRKELRKRIFQAISQLGGRQKRCFILRYFGGLSIREVASVVGCGEGTAKRHLFRARERLRQMLISE